MYILLHLVYTLCSHWGPDTNMDISKIQNNHSFHNASTSSPRNLYLTDTFKAHLVTEFQQLTEYKTRTEI